MTDQDQAVEQFIHEAFEQNYQVLRLEAARTLSPAGREAAFRQVLMYWRKMRQVAESITDTEVKLTLPNQESPAGREFSIHGVVDIVREAERTIMYDIKTHDPEYVRSHIDLYTDQLNVYAHIWHELRGEPLDETGIIGTRLPPQIHRALDAGDMQQLEYAMQNWDPLVPIPLDSRHVQETVEEFGHVVDEIEDHHFAPVDIGRLRQIVYANETFAFRNCRQCDARFSCDSYREYMRETQPRDERRYWRHFEDYGLEEERESWQTATLDASPAADDLVADFERER
jgi:hypothetical protein